MAEKNKGGLLFLGALGLGGALLWLTRKPKEAEETGLTLSIFDSEGRKVAALPGAITDGATYTLDMNITNRSTRAGVGVGVSFDIVGTIKVAGITILDIMRTEAFAAGQTRTISQAFAIPAGRTGAGAVAVTLYPAGLGTAIRSATLSFTVGAAAIIYDADLVLS